MPFGSGAAVVKAGQSGCMARCPIHNHFKKSCWTVRNLRNEYTTENWLRQPAYRLSNIRKRKTQKDAALVTATRWAVYRRLMDTGMAVECGSGALTKMNRVKIGLPKEHYYDACCVGRSMPERLHISPQAVQYIKSCGRGSRSRTNLNKYGFPRGYFARKKDYFGFQTGDMVKAVVPKGKYAGIWYGRVLCRASGNFDIKTKHGRKGGINHRHINLVQRNDSYEYKTTTSSPRLKPGASVACSRWQCRRATIIIWKHPIKARRLYVDSDACTMPIEHFFAVQHVLLGYDAGLVD